MAALGLMPELFSSLPALDSLPRTECEPNFLKKYKTNCVGTGQLDIVPLPVPALMRMGMTT